MNLCKRPTYWFDAAINGDVKYIEKNLQQNKENYDPRQTKDKVFQGISALHYSIIYNQDQVFDILFPSEYHLLTDQPITIKSAQANLSATVPPGSSIIMLCIAGDRQNFLTKILSHIQQNQQYQNLLGTTNDASQTALAMCPLYHNSCSNLFINNEMCVRYELKIRQIGNVNFIMQCAACLNQDILNWIVTLLKSNCKGIVQEIKTQFQEQDDRGFTYIQWLQSDTFKQQIIDLAEAAMKQ